MGSKIFWGSEYPFFYASFTFLWDFYKIFIPGTACWSESYHKKGYINIYFKLHWGKIESYKQRNIFEVFFHSKVSIKMCNKLGIFSMKMRWLYKDKIYYSTSIFFFSIGILNMDFERFLMSLFLSLYPVVQDRFISKIRMLLLISFHLIVHYSLRASMLGVRSMIHMTRLNLCSILSCLTSKDYH